MKKINWLLSVMLIMLVFLSLDVNGGVEKVDYEIRYNYLNNNVLSIKEQLEDTYYELVKNVDDDYKLNVLYEGLNRFYFEGVSSVSIDNHTLMVELGENATHKIKGSLYERCESDFQKRSFINDLFNR